MGMQQVEGIEKLAKALVPLKFIVKKFAFPKISGISLRGFRKLAKIQLVKPHKQEVLFIN